MVVNKIIDILLVFVRVYKVNIQTYLLNIIEIVYIVILFALLCYVIWSVKSVFSSKIYINKLAKMNLYVVRMGNTSCKYKLNTVDLTLLSNGNVVIFNKKNGVHTFERENVKYLRCANQYFYFKGRKWRKVTLKYKNC